MLDAERRFFAEEVQAVANLRTPGLVDAFAAVPRERFLSVFGMRSTSGTARRCSACRFRGCRSSVDTHAPGPTCWLHGSTFCLST